MPPADGSSLQKSRLMGPQLAHLWWPAGAKLQAASAPVAQAVAPWDRQTDEQTDGSRYSKTPSMTGSIKILLFD